MTNRLWQTAVERAGALAAPLVFDEMFDAELLRRFVAMREECAFAAIVRRHGPIVWAVCRSYLPSEADAEDAFQATFLVLVRSAAKVKKPNALAPGCTPSLGVFVETACGRWLAGESTSGRPQVRRPTTRLMRHSWDRWQAIAHEEIDRLPESLRIAFVVCVMQGVRQQDAAERLGWKIGTVSGRVCKAKQLLSEAITRRGLVGPVVLAAALGAAATPLAAGLASNCIQVGTRSGEVSTTIHELARGAMGGFMSKAKLATIVLVAGTLTIGVGTRVLSTADAQPGPGGSAGAAGGVNKGQTPPPGPPQGVAPSSKGGSPPAGGVGAAAGTARRNAGTSGMAPPGGFPGMPGAGASAVRSPRPVQKSSISSSPRRIPRTRSRSCSQRAGPMDGSTLDWCREAMS